MRALLLLCASLFPLNSYASLDVDGTCAEAVLPTNIYLQPSSSKFPLSDREDRKESAELPGREGNIQRFLERQVRKLSPEAKELAQRINLFFRAGRLYSPPEGDDLSDYELSKLLFKTEELIIESPSHLFNVPTSTSVNQKIDEVIRSHQSTQRLFMALAGQSEHDDEKLVNVLNQAESRHQSYLAELRAAIPTKVSDLINRISSEDLSAVLSALRRILSERHPIFGDVRTDARYPKTSRAEWSVARQEFWKEYGTGSDEDDRQLDLEILRQRLNPPPVQQRTKGEKQELSGLRESYVQLIRALPSFEGVVYWGADQSGDIVSELIPGQIFEIKPFYNDVNVFAGTPYYNNAVAQLLEKTHWPHLVLYKINSRHGRITEGAFSTDTFPQVLFLPGTQFLIDSHEFLDGIHYVEITEVTGSIAKQPKEQELKVLLKRQIRDGQKPPRIRDIAGRKWRVWYDTEPEHEKSFSAFAWRTVMSSLGISSVDAFRIPLDAKTTVYVEEELDLPQLDSVPKGLNKQWMIPSYLALASTLLRDKNIYAGKISVYDRGGGRWIASDFWNKPSLFESLLATTVKPIDAISDDPQWKPFFKSQEPIFFLWEHINLVFPSDILKRQLGASSKAERAMVDRYLMTLKTNFDAAEHFIRNKYVYRRTEERGRGGMIPL